MGVQNQAKTPNLATRYFNTRCGRPMITGLAPGDRWCVCAARWLQVQQAGAACPIILEATHENTLKIVPFELLIQYAVIPSQLH